MKHLGDILKKQKKGLAGGEEGAQYAAMKVFRAIADDVLPESVQQSYGVSHIEHGKLVLLVPNSAVAQEIQIQKHQLLSRLQKEVPEAGVTAIVLRQKR